jgi:glycosyltransferase involved in cell wall biosynthesis
MGPGQRQCLCLIITRMVAGGAQKVLIDLIDGMPMVDVDVHVIAGPETGREGSLWADLRDRLPQSNLHTCSHLVRSPNPIADFLAYRQLKSLFKRLRPTIVHTHTSKAGVVGRWAAHHAGVPKIIHSTHGLIYDPDAKIPGVKQGVLLKLFLKLEQIVGRWTDHLITLSEKETGDAIRLRLAPPPNIQAISNGIPLPELASIERDPDSWKVPHLRLGIAGRLNSEKGHEVLLKSMAKLKSSFPHLCLKVAGDGPLRNSLEKECDSLGLKNQVVFLGYQEDMKAFLSGIDIFVLSSHYEGFGLVLVEAMAAGLPVVATDVGGVGEVVIDGRTGIVVPSGREDELAMGIEYFLHHPNLAYKYGQDGRVHAMEKFSRQQMVRRHLELYHNPTKGKVEQVVPNNYIPVDLHMHSYHSFDSKMKMESILEGAWKNGIRAIAVTDHDTLDGALEASRLAPKGLIVIKGMEITSEVGDIIALFIDEPIKSLDLEGIVKEVRAQEGLLYLPHPFRGRRSLALDLVKNMDVFEIFNGRSQGINYSEDQFGNREIVQFAQEYQLTGIGGSDAHKPGELFRVLTYLPSFDHEDELKAHLSSGRIFPVLHQGEWMEESLDAFQSEDNSVR